MGRKAKFTDDLKPKKGKGRKAKKQKDPDFPPNLSKLRKLLSLLFKYRQTQFVLFQSIAFVGLNLNSSFIIQGPTIHVCLKVFGVAYNYYINRYYSINWMVIRGESYNPRIPVSFSISKILGFWLLIPLLTGFYVGPRVCYFFLNLTITGNSAIL